MQIEIEKNEEQINWDKQNILISKDEDIIIITDRRHEDGVFSGTTLDFGCYTNHGCYQENWKKSEFKLFKGTIKN